MPIANDWVELMTRGFFSEIAKIYSYRFDGVDDYAIVDIPLFDGDVVEFDFVSNSAVSGNKILLGQEALNNGSIIYIRSDGKWRIPVGYIASAYVDNVEIQSDVTDYPIDMKRHVVKLVVSGEGYIGEVGSYKKGEYLFNNVISNLRITRENPNPSYPNLFYPMDERGGSVMIENLNGGDWNGTYVNFNQENWIAI